MTSNMSPLEENRVSGIGGATSRSAPRFFKVVVNMQWIRENPPYFSYYYLKGHQKPRINDLLYVKTPWGGFESANLKVAGFSRGAIRPGPVGE